jgi:hypothetical protein
VNECCEQKKSDTDEEGDVRNVVGEHLHIDEVDDSAVEPSVSTKDPVYQVSQRSSKDEAKGNSLDTARRITEDDHDHHDDADRHNGKDRALIGEQRETGPCVEREPEVEHVRDDDNRCVSERVDSPRFGDLVDRCNNDSDDNRKLSVAQPRWAASTVIVAYGIASSRATGIGSPVTSHIPYRPFSIRS